MLDAAQLIYAVGKEILSAGEKVTHAQQQRDAMMRQIDNALTYTEFVKFMMTGRAPNFTELQNLHDVIFIKLKQLHKVLESVKAYIAKVSGYSGIKWWRKHDDVRRNFTNFGNEIEGAVSSIQNDVSNYHIVVTGNKLDEIQNVQQIQLNQTQVEEFNKYWKTQQDEVRHNELMQSLIQLQNKHDLPYVATQVLETKVAAMEAKQNLAELKEEEKVEIIREIADVEVVDKQLRDAAMVLPEMENIVTAVARLQTIDKSLRAYKTLEKTLEDQKFFEPEIINMNNLSKSGRMPGYDDYAKWLQSAKTMLQQVLPVDEKNRELDVAKQLSKVKEERKTLLNGLPEEIKEEIQADGYKKTLMSLQNEIRFFNYFEDYSTKRVGRSKLPNFGEWMKRTESMERTIAALHDKIDKQEKISDEVTAMIVELDASRMQMSLSSNTTATDKPTKKSDGFYS